MKCNCSEIYEAILQIIRAREKDFHNALSEGPPSVRDLKLTILDSIHKVFKDKPVGCTCYIGQHLQRMNEIIKNFYERKEQIKIDYSQSAYENETVKVFDKINLILYNLNK